MPKKSSKENLEALLVKHDKDYAKVAEELKIGVPTLCSYISAARVDYRLRAGSRKLPVKARARRDPVISSQRPRLQNEECWDIDWSACPLAARYPRRQLCNPLPPNSDLKIPCTSST